MATECGFCKGTGIEPGFTECVWCDNTGRDGGISPEAIKKAIAPRFTKCDGNHGGPRCADPECWNDGPDICPTCDDRGPCPVCMPEPEPSGLTWWAQGDANFYTLLKDGHWYAVIQMNGELGLADQEAFLNGICPQHSAVADGKARDV